MGWIWIQQIQPFFATKDKKQTRIRIQKHYCLIIYLGKTQSCHLQK